MRKERLEPIPDVLVIRPDVHPDARGSFAEILREDQLGMRFVQANHSRSRAGVLRGLHYHRRQADAWYVVSGHAQVGLADLRDASLQPAVATLELSGSEPALLYIPSGVAHGFLALTDIDLIYWVTEYYDGADEFSVAWDDPVLALPWVLATPILSARDAEAPRLDRKAIRTSGVSRAGGG